MAKFRIFMEQDEVLNENWLQNLSQMLFRTGKSQNIPGATPEEKLGQIADSIQMVLDAAGIIDPSGIADGANGVISLIRAIGDRQRWPQHTTNALISFISIIPFGDLVKLVKMKAGRQAAKAAIQGVRQLQQQGSQQARMQRLSQNVQNMYVAPNFS